MDALDVRIIDALRGDGRCSIRDLARQLDVPETTVRDHIHRMEENGVIAGHRPIIAPLSAGVSESAWVFARCEEGARTDVTEALGRDAQVVAVRRFATDPEHFALHIQGSTETSVASAVERFLQDHPIRIKNVVPIDQTPRADPETGLYWPDHDGSNGLLGYKK